MLLQIQQAARRGDLHPVGRGKKKQVLLHIINENNWSQVLVFTRTKFGANNVAEFLTKNNISAMALHGNKSQSARTQALAGFKTGELRALGVLSGQQQVEVRRARLGMAQGVYCASVHAQRFEQLAKRNDVMAQMFDDPDTAGTNARERAIIQAALPRGCRPPPA